MRLTKDPRKRDEGSDWTGAANAETARPPSTAAETLRSFDTLRQTTPPNVVIAEDERRMALHGGGDAYARPWHWHDCLMLILPTSGALDLQHERRREGGWLSEGQFAIVPAGMAHETVASRDTSSHVALYVRDDALKSFEAEMGSLAGISRLDGVAVYDAGPAVRSLQTLCGGAADGPGLRPAMSRISDALIIYCLSVILTEDPLPVASRRGHGSALVGEVKSLIERESRNEMPLDQVAERFGLSRRHLTRIFRERTGMSIGEYQSRARLGIARRLLLSTDLPIGEIAFRVGFEDGSAFSRALRRHEGRSPRELRASMARPAAS